MTIHTIETKTGDTEPHELASTELPEGTSSWQASVSADYPEGVSSSWSQTVGANGAAATVRRDGDSVEVLSSIAGDHEALPFRTWLEARDGAVRVMVASRGPAWVFRLGFLKVGATAQPRKVAGDA